MWLRNPFAVWCCQVGVDIVHYHLIAPSKPLGLDLILRYERDQTRELIKLGYEDTKRVLEKAME